MKADSNRSKIEAQFNRAYISEDDFDEAETYLEELVNAPTDHVRRALLLAAIICYSRPFSANTASPSATSTLKRTQSKVLDESEKVLHKKILALRNRALAHSDYDAKPVKRTGGTKDGFSVRFRRIDLLSENIDETEFLLLCRKLRKHSAKLSMDLNNKLAAPGHAL